MGKFVLALVPVLLMGAGCLGPEIGDGEIVCDSDGLCPPGFECAINERCYRYAGTCEDSVLDPGETCDPPGVCPTSCNDGNSCTADGVLGAAATCNFQCVRASVEACESGDGCCPDGCNSDSDSDCVATCNNGALDPGESCDPSAAVPCEISCGDGDACTVDTPTGSAQNCNVGCSYLEITGCMNDDGCCPPTCSSGNDNDCSPTCGNDTIDPGETCDPPSTCPAIGSCNDDIACTADLRLGSAANCNARCVFVPISQCNSTPDGCCPAECSALNDADCAAADTCGNGELDPGETCDDTSSQTCPVDCEAVASDEECLRYDLVGSSQACDAQCSKSTITQCINGDGCCPPGCGIGTGFGPLYRDDDCRAKSGG